MTSRERPLCGRRCRSGIHITLVVIVGHLALDSVHAVDEEMAAAQARFEEIVPWLPRPWLPDGKLIAFEEHAEFAYLAGRSSPEQEPSAGARTRLVFLRPATLVVDVWPFDPQRRDLGKPTAISTIEVTQPGEQKVKRAVLVYDSPRQESSPKRHTIRMQDGMCDVVITSSGRTTRLVLPMDVGQPARIAIESSDGQTILARRHLPAGVMPYGLEGRQLIEGWDSRYRADSRPAWDKGFPSTHLKAAVDSGQIKSGRAIVLGCGTGTNAIYLAKQGFDVTAIDIAPTALNLAESKAEKERVKVRWLLADVLAPPVDLETFDFIFDRGCYHGVRRVNAEGYVQTIRRLSRPDTLILVLAGNANEERHYGPPRVKEEELRADFSADFHFVRLDTIRFDSVDPQQQGALAWSVLLRPKADR